MSEKIENSPKQPKSSLARLGRRVGQRAGVALIAAKIGHPSRREIQAILDEEARNKVVSSEQDVNTGVITQIRGDGSRRVVQPAAPDDIRWVATTDNEQQRLKLERAVQAPSATDPHIQDNHRQV